MLPDLKHNNNAELTGVRGTRNSSMTPRRKFRNDASNSLAKVVETLILDISHVVREVRLSSKRRSGCVDH